MTYDPSATNKPRLDDLLATMGITREQLTEMTADELFAAATRWQGETALAADAKRFAFPVDLPLDSLRVPPAGVAGLN